MSRLQLWFEEVKGLRVEEPETGEIFKIVDVRDNATIFIGLSSEGAHLSMSLLTVLMSSFQSTDGIC